MRVDRDLFDDILTPFDFVTGDMTAAARHFHKYGILVAKRAIEPEKLAPYVGNANAFYQDVRKARASSDEVSLTDMKEKKGLSLVNNSASLDALLGEGEGVPDFLSLYQNGKVDKFLCSIVNTQMNYSNPTRLRCYYADDEAENAGHISLHQDNGHASFNLTFTVWTPLMPPGLVANKDASGIRLIPFRPPYNIGTAGSPSFKGITLKDLVRVGVLTENDLPRIDDYFVYPECETGDVVIFDGYIPHGTTPWKFAHDRISVDVRASPLLGTQAN